MVRVPLRDRTELRLVIDQRLFELVTQACEVEEWTFDLAVAYMRAAYAAGHGDAMREDDPSMLYRGRGYAVPQRGEEPLGWRGEAPG